MPVRRRTGPPAAVSPSRVSRPHRALGPGPPDAELPGMSHAALAVGRHRAPEHTPETIASLADVDRPGRHAEPDADLPIYDALRAELAAVDWFSLDVE